MATRQQKYLVGVQSVTKTNNFPIDMLRYDRATPHSELDVIKIGESIGVHTLASHPETIFVQMHKKPSEARWLSFGWRVISVKLEPY